MAAISCFASVCAGAVVFSNATVPAQGRSLFKERPMSAVPRLSWQESFLQVLPAVQTHAKIQFRRLSTQKREEAIQETIATACVNYQLAALQGKLNVIRGGSLADFAVKRVRAGRHVGGHQDGTGDVLSF